LKKGAALISLLILFGCSSASAELNKLENQYPVIEKELKTLPDETLAKVKVPSYVPFKPDTVTSNVQLDADKDPLFTEIQYAKANNAVLFVTTYFDRVESIDPNMPMSLKLKDGTLAEFRLDRANAKELIWSDKKQKTTYLIRLLVKDYTNNPWTKDDIIKMAESMKK
jgi:hypothetical protein